MAYVPTTFVDRSVEFPNRRKLAAVSGLADTFDVTRAEGTVFAAGTKLDAANLNAEFGKIKTETDSIITNLTAEITRLTNKFKVVTGTTSAVNVPVSASYPSGFNQNNTVILSVNVFDTVRWVETDGSSCVGFVRSSDLGIQAILSTYANKSFKMTIMRTDI